MNGAQSVMMALVLLKQMHVICGMLNFTEGALCSALSGSLGQGQGKCTNDGVICMSLVSSPGSTHPLIVSLSANSEPEDEAIYKHLIS